MADGVLSLKGTLVGARGSGSGGHVIKDNGTAVTQRPTMNMTDFDIADDNTNEETDIKPHRITSAEMSEICSPLPDAPTLVGNVRMSLLWTNQDPTQTFGSQNVSMNVAGFDMFFISLKYSTSHDIYVNFVAIKDSNMRMDTVTGASGASSFRDILFDSTNNYMTVSVVAGEKSGNNAHLIPYKVYGIKLV